MADTYTASALAAALTVARRHGLGARVPKVLHERSNVLVRLGSVVARVPGRTRLLRPDATAWLARDVALSHHLTQSGVRVVSPTVDPPAGPHFAEGLPVTLWHWTPHDPDHRHTPDEVARSLAAVHAALLSFPGELPRRFPGELPRRGPVDELFAALDRHGDTMDGAAGRIRAETLRLAADLPVAVQPRHGDAHPGNVIATPDGPCWLDFEDAWLGPLAWDLAILAKQGGPEFLAAYPAGNAPTSPNQRSSNLTSPTLDRPAAASPAELAVCGRLRERFVVVWRYLLAIRFPHRLGEARSALADYFAG
ncbi:MAG TPA: aminoglycoside phosphotransferase family protein [Amycolatopsis sp.]|nr:aminoglycoside phosphotransferase family protein [Amycolatopsis sp.]